MQQTHKVMDDGDHGLARHACVAMSDLYGDLLVLAEEHLRIVLAIIDQRIVQSAIAGPRVQGDVFEPVAFDHVYDNVRLPSPIGFLDGARFTSSRLCHMIDLLSFGEIIFRPRAKH